MSQSGYPYIKCGRQPAAFLQKMISKPPALLGFEQSSEMYTAVCISLSSTLLLARTTGVFVRSSSCLNSERFSEPSRLQTPFAHAFSVLPARHWFRVSSMPKAAPSFSGARARGCWCLRSRRKRRPWPGPVAALEIFVRWSLYQRIKEQMTWRNSTCWKAKSQVSSTECQGKVAPVADSTGNGTPKIVRTGL